MAPLRKPNGELTGHAARYRAKRREAAIWLAAQAVAPYPLVPALMTRFALDKSSAKWVATTWRIRKRESAKRRAAEQPPPVVVILKRRNIRNQPAPPRGSDEASL